LHGQVLEVNAGRGGALDAYRTAAHVVAAEPVGARRRRLLRHSRQAAVPSTVIDAHAEQLPFPDATFDAVVSILPLCRVKNQARALAEIRRVLKPDGTLVFLEHVKTTKPWLMRAKKAGAPLMRRLAAGCRLNRDTVLAIRDAGFEFAILDFMEPAPRIPVAGTLARGRAYKP
jgi:ubiquinone/menaquinone biosynthesis C-methylase UbiE